MFRRSWLRRAVGLKIRYVSKRRSFVFQETDFCTQDRPACRSHGSVTRIVRRTFCRCTRKLALDCKAILESVLKSNFAAGRLKSNSLCVVKTRHIYKYASVSTP
jgi:hypothetical protein